MSNATRNVIDPTLVRDWFAHRAASFAGGGFLLREIGQRLAERLDYIRLNPDKILDLGCADGAGFPLLQQRYPVAQVYGVDWAVPMLEQAQQRWGARASWKNRVLQSMGLRSNQPPAQYLAADFAALPIAAQQIDLIWSNCALHWQNNPHEVLAEWQRVLRVDGLLMFSTFGPDTFRELRAAFGAAHARHVLPFVDMHDLGDMLVQAGFATPVMDMERITLTYSSISELFAEVRSLGGNVLRARPAGLQGRQYWQVMQHALEDIRQSDRRIPLTIEVVYGHAWKAQPRQIADGRAVVRFQRRSIK